MALAQGSLYLLNQELAKHSKVIEAPISDEPNFDKDTRESMTKKIEDNVQKNLTGEKYETSTLVAPTIEIIWQAQILATIVVLIAVLKNDMGIRMRGRTNESLNRCLHAFFVAIRIMIVLYISYRISDLIAVIVQAIFGWDTNAYDVADYIFFTLLPYGLLISCCTVCFQNSRLGT